MGNYILSGRLPAVASTTVSAILSMLIAPLAYLLSGSILGLISLRKGPAFGMQVLLISLGMLVAFAIAAGAFPELMIAYAVVVWLPVWVTASALRITERQGLLVVSAATLAIAVVLSMYMVVGDVAGWWQKLFFELIDKSAKPTQVEELKAVVLQAAPFINAAMAAGLMMNILSSVLLARWWQSRLFNQGAFQKEFYALSLPTWVLFVTAVMVAMGFLANGKWQLISIDILIIMMFVFLIQGISAVHRIVTTMQLSSGLLVAMYVLLVLMPYMSLFIAILGMTDVYMQWRKNNRRSQEDS